MDKKSRIEYLICTLSIVVTGFIIYGLLASYKPLINESKLQSFLLFGCLGGFGFSAIVSTIILSVGFFKKRGLVFKIIASVLWPITFGVCVYAGIFSYIPYQIYNIVKIISLIREEKNKKSQKILQQKLEFSFLDILTLRFLMVVGYLFKTCTKFAPKQKSRHKENP